MVGMYDLSDVHVDMRVSLCVTRHPALVAYLREEGLIAADTPVIEHATRADVANRVVAGVLPLALASFARAVIEVPLDLPAEARGRELTIEEVRRYAGPAWRYRVQAEARCPDCGGFGCDGCE